MASGTEFILKLVDRLTAPARAMERALKQVNASQNAAVRGAEQATAATSALGSAMARAGAQAAVGAAGMRAFSVAAARASVASRFAGARTRFNKWVGDAEGGADFIGPRQSRGGEWRTALANVGAWNTRAGEAIAKWGEMRASFMGTPFGFVARGISAIGSGVLQLGQYLLSAAWSAAKLTYGMAALAAAWLTKEVLEGAMFMDRAKNSFRALTGSIAGGTAAFARAKRVAGELGTSIEETTQSFIDLMAAQFKAAEAETLVKLSRDLQSVTGHADAASRAINAITKIKSTGRLQGDELMMLAEAGLSLDLVYGNLEKRFGKTRDQIIKMQAAGKISAVEAIDAIQKAIMQKLHEARPGEAAARYATGTFAGVWQQLQNAPKNFLLRIGERVDTGPLLQSMRRITDVINKADGAMIVTFVNHMASALARVLTILPHFAEGFARGFENVTKALSGLTERDWEGSAARAGEFLGRFLSKSLALAAKLLPVIEKLFDRFAKGFDADALVAQLERIDFARLAEDFGKIAEACGVIMRYTAKAAPYVVATAQLGSAALTDPTYLAPTGGAPIDKYGRPLAPGTENAPVAIPEALRGEGMFPAIGRTLQRWLLPEGVGQYDPSGQTPGLPTTAEEAARMGPTASISRAGGTTFVAHISVQGGMTPEETARLTERAARRVFQGLVDREVATG